MTLQHDNVKYEPVSDGRLGDSFEDDSRTAFDEASSSSPLSFNSSHSCEEAIRKPWLVAIFVFAVMAAAFVAGISGYYFGRAAESDEHTLDWFSPPGTVDHTFHYRQGFALPPGEESQKYWNMIFPRGRGFIQHPVISPEPHGLAVYHQLHCLDAIRRGYYAARDGVEPEHGSHSAPGHVRHCIDYLRQSLMCNADTNLEPIDMQLGGVTGFGNERKCRDIVRIMKFADKWRTHNQTIIT